VELDNICDEVVIVTEKKFPMRKTAGKILEFICQLEIEEGITGIGSNGIAKELDIKEGEVRTALKYLKKRGLIDGKKMVGGNWMIVKLTREGLETCENEGKYKRHFSIKAKIPLIAEAEWGVEER